MLTMTKTFNNVYPDADTFLADYKAFELAVDNINKIDDKYVKLTWLLISSRKGMSAMALDDENQFKLGIWDVIFQYGPAWAKRLEVQDKLVKLDLEDLQEGDKTIYNTAAHNATKISATSPKTTDLGGTPYVNNQMVTNKQKGKLEAWRDLLLFLETDVTEQYLNKFFALFSKFISAFGPIYITEGED